MSDPSGERVALSDAFLMLLFPLATQDAICLSWVCTVLYGHVLKTVRMEVQAQVQTAMRPTAKREPMTAFNPEGFLKLLKKVPVAPRLSSICQS